MKFIFSIFLVFASHLALANFECSQIVNPIRTEKTFVITKPSFHVSLEFTDCVSGSCSGGVQEQIAYEYSVCRHYVDVKKDCALNETDRSLEVHCTNGYSLIFSIDALSKGRIACLYNGMIEQTWYSGTCSKIN